jgi:pyruvate/2-oxoglutarate dehydrogenase complex dihydrolipoamide acyltransferase (E2) component
VPQPYGSVPMPYAQPPVPEPKKPVHKRVWVWAAATVTVLAVIGAISGGDKKPDAHDVSVVAALTATGTPLSAPPSPDAKSAAAASSAAASSAAASASASASAQQSDAAAQALIAACSSWNVPYLQAIQVNDPSATRAAQTAWEATWAATMPAGCTPTPDVTAALVAARATAAALEDAAKAPATVPARTTAAPAPAASVATPRPAAAYYANCDAARAAGAAPLYRGQPGYRPALDRDGDGIACE